MSALLELAVVIPTFNERANVPVLIAKLDQALAGLMTAGRVVGRRAGVVESASARGLPVAPG